MRSRASRICISYSAPAEKLRNRCATTGPSASITALRAVRSIRIVSPPARRGRPGEPAIFCAARCSDPSTSSTDSNRHLSKPCPPLILPQRAASISSASRSRMRLVFGYSPPSAGSAGFGGEPPHRDDDSSREAPPRMCFRLADFFPPGHLRAATGVRPSPKSASARRDRS